MKNLFKQLVLTLLSAFVTSVVVYGGYTIYAADDYSFADPSRGFDFVRDEYHEEMNEYFNEKTEMLVDMIDEGDYLDNANFLAPASLEDCTDENVSSYCVSMGALDRYMSYLATLGRVSGYLERFDDEDSAELLLSRTNERDLEIAQEIEFAEDVMKGAMAVYSEYRAAYPMHIGYQEVIRDLNKYKNHLKEIRQGVRHFPLRFVDATALHCK